MAVIDEGTRYTKAVLAEWSRKIFMRVGVSETDAAVLTDSLLEANLRGVDTHGVTRMLPIYIRRIQAGIMSPKTKLEIVREKPGTALIDCHNSIGQVSANFAMDLAITKAKDVGTAFVAIAHSNHYGTSAYWAMKALDHGMIGFSCVNAPAAVAPIGGRKPMFGTNPFAVAVPVGKELPFVLDLATTVVARGRIDLFRRQNKALEPGWAFDAMGRPTTDPVEAMKGLLAPMAGYKGYGIAFAIDILSGILTSSNYGRHFPGMLAENLEKPTDVGGVFAAISIDSFMDLKEFNDRMEKACREVRECDKAEGVDRIYIPGEIEHNVKAERLVRGIPLPDAIRADFEQLGAELNVPFPK
jgi:LDH2 family malate/lactate/ureidoglycolate dehydrogenase